MDFALQVYIIFPYITSFCLAWDYSDPSTWSSTYSNCGGTSQSPIALTESSMTPATFEGFSLTDEDVTLTATLSNNGHSAKVTFTETITVTGGGLGGIFKVAQFHFHWGNDSSRGSEHTLNGAQHILQPICIFYPSPCPFEVSSRFYRPINSLSVNFMPSDNKFTTSEFIGL
ncbi:carbonic anhydrase-like [Saccostrea echinata]|uniref:carbonic anhydrase-like n=1 Tax=Saccostrea echinata TaxID=191078 RepID=UPI002A82B6E6|nr:carbonic anhydrase-like [Saccostrea echinata]